MAQLLKMLTQKPPLLTKASLIDIQLWSDVWVGGHVYLTATWPDWETPCPTYAIKLERDFLQFLKF